MIELAGRDAKPKSTDKVLSETVVELRVRVAFWFIRTTSVWSIVWEWISRSMSFRRDHVGSNTSTALTCWCENRSKICCTRTTPLSYFKHVYASKLFFMRTMKTLETQSSIRLFPSKLSWPTEIDFHPAKWAIFYIVKVLKTSKIHCPILLSKNSLLIDWSSRDRRVDCRHENFSLVKVICHVSNYGTFCCLVATKWYAICSFGALEKQVLLLFTWISQLGECRIRHWYYKHAPMSWRHPFIL